MNLKIPFRDSFNFNLKYHKLDFLPQKLRGKIIKTLIKLKLIKTYGKITVTVNRYNGKIEKHTGYNLIPDIGIKHIGDILIGVETTNLTLAYMEADQGTTNPTIADTDSETPVTPADRLAVTLINRNSVSPFEITTETFISSAKYSRPVTIAKLNVFFGPDETGDLFASGKLDTPVTLNTSDTATLTYAFIWR